MKVKIRIGYSKTRNKPSGVPRGSVQRAYLFLILINNLHKGLNIRNRTIC